MLLCVFCWSRRTFNPCAFACVWHFQRNPLSLPSCQISLQALQKVTCSFFSPRVKPHYASHDLACHLSRRLAIHHAPWQLFFDSEIIHRSPVQRERWQVISHFRLSSYQSSLTRTWEENESDNRKSLWKSQILFCFSGWISLFISGYTYLVLVSLLKKSIFLLSATKNAKFDHYFVLHFSFSKEARIMETVFALWCKWEIDQLKALVLLYGLSWIAVSRLEWLIRGGWGGGVISPLTFDQWINNKYTVIKIPF